MIKNKKKEKGVLSIIIVASKIITELFLVLWLYHFPLQRIMAEIKYNEYSKLQGVVADDIATKKVYKDYKQGGYYVTVTYHSDSKYYYDYHYYLINFRRDGVKYHTMSCITHNLKNPLADSYDDVKYKSLE